MNPSLTFITTCRGRLEHLKQTLPLLVAQPNTACIVVDYDCPEQSGDWVEANFPEVKVVRSGPRKRFETARARNLGAQVATTEWLAFLDADALVRSDFAESILRSSKPGNYYLPEGNEGSLAGSLVGQCVVTRDDFERIGGYDGVLQGWGMEDKDLYFRLFLAGSKQLCFPPALVSMISHGDDMRVQHPQIKGRRLNSTLNLMYCRAKWDLTRLGAVKEMSDESARTTLYKTFVDSMKDAILRGTSCRVAIPFSSQATAVGQPLSGTLIYEVPVHKSGTTTAESGR